MTLPRRRRAAPAAPPTTAVGRALADLEAGGESLMLGVLAVCVLPFAPLFALAWIIGRVQRAITSREADA